MALAVRQANLEEKLPAELDDWTVVGFSDAAVGFIDSILLGQASHKHWKAGGFALKALAANRIVLPKVAPDQQLGTSGSGEHIVAKGSVGAIFYRFSTVFRLFSD